jgi:murein DD-endopeptidase MepM/ murein hydrolase activator NlpD
MRHASILALVLVLVGVSPVYATPDPGDAPSPAPAPTTAAPAEADDDDEVGDEIGEAEPSRPRHTFHWSDGPRAVPTPRGASLARATALGLGTSACAHALLRATPEERWLDAARGRSPSRLLWPVDDARWGRGFGYVRTTRPDLIHRGADIVAPEGSVVRAAADGIVAYADNGVHGYGNVVMIVHRNGWMTLYAHNSRITVQPGYRVRRGERIALVGQTGIAHGPHVHFELWDHGHAVDPAALFDGGPAYVQRMAERAAARGLVPPPSEVTAADRPVEAPLRPLPTEPAPPSSRATAPRRAHR